MSGVNTEDPVMRGGSWAKINKLDKMIAKVATNNRKKVFLFLIVKSVWLLVCLRWKAHTSFCGFQKRRHYMPGFHGVEPAKKKKEAMAVRGRAEREFLAIF